METLLLVTGVGFCCVILGLAAYTIYNTHKMKPLETDPILSLKEVEKSDAEVVEATEKISAKLSNMIAQLNKKGIDDPLILVAIDDIDKSTSLIKEKTVKSHGKLTKAVLASPPFNLHKYYYTRHWEDLREIDLEKSDEKVIVRSRFSTEE